MKILSSDNSTIQIDLGESLTFNEHRAFRQLIEEASKDKKAIVFQCKELNYLDSAGLGMLLLAKHETAKYNKNVDLIGIQGRALQLLQTVSFDKHFHLKS